MYMSPIVHENPLTPSELLAIYEVKTLLLYIRELKCQKLYMKSFSTYILNLDVRLLKILIYLVYYVRSTSLATKELLLR